jgi:hypothetical protein
VCLRLTVLLSSIWLSSDAKNVCVCVCVCICMYWWHLLIIQMSVPVYTHVLVLCPDNDPHSRSKLSCQITDIHKRVSCVWFQTLLPIWVCPFYSIVFKIKCVVRPATSSHAHYTEQMFNCKFGFKHWIISEIKSWETCGWARDCNHISLRECN